MFGLDRSTISKNVKKFASQFIHIKEQFYDKHLIDNNKDKHRRVQKLFMLCKGWTI
jgi:hypothetical protein